MKRMESDNKMLYYYDCGQLELTLTGGLWDPEEKHPTEGTEIFMHQLQLVAGQRLFL